MSGPPPAPPTAMPMWASRPSPQPDGDAADAAIDLNPATLAFGETNGGASGDDVDEGTVRDPSISSLPGRAMAEWRDPGFSDAASELHDSFGQWALAQQLEFMSSLMHLMPRFGLVSLSDKLSRFLSRDVLTDLPDEIAEKVFSYLSFQEVLRCERVCKSWYRRLRGSSWIWRTVCQTHAAHVKGAWAKYYAQYQLLRRPLDSSDHWKQTFKSIETDIRALNRNWNSDGKYLVKADGTVPQQAATVEQWSLGKITKIPCQGNGIYCLQYDSEKIVSGSRDNTVKIWKKSSAAASAGKADAGRQRTDNYVLDAQLVGHAGSVLCLQFDDKKIISGSSDASVRIWDIETLEEILALPNAHETSVLHLRFDQERLVTCSKDKSVRVWRLSPDGRQCQLEMRLEGHGAAVNVVEFDHRYIVSASGDRTVRVWNTVSGRLERHLVGHDRGIACLQYRGKYVVTGSSDNTIRVWNVDTGAEIRKLAKHTDLVRCVRFDENRIVSGSYDRTIRIWDFKTGEELAKLTGHENRVFRVQFDDFKIVSSSQDDHIIIWDFRPEHSRELLD